MNALVPLKDRSSLEPLKQLGWVEVEGRDAIQKTYEFKTFIGAFGWMTQVAMVAERLGHHPEWSNVYNRVLVTLTTHDAGGVTELDVRMANRIESLAQAGLKN